MQERNTHEAHHSKKVFLIPLRSWGRNSAANDCAEHLGFEQVHKLVYDLQQLAKDSGHEQPLMIGIDQENGS